MRFLRLSGRFPQHTICERARLFNFHLSIGRDVANSYIWQTRRRHAMLFGLNFRVRAQSQVRTRMFNALESRVSHMSKIGIKSSMQGIFTGTSALI